MLKIKNKASISSRTYNFGKRGSRSYIYDEDLHYAYLLKGISSDIWYVIFSSSNYADVLDYAKKHEVDDELDDFIKELYANNLVDILNSKSVITSKSVSRLKVSEDLDVFDEDRKAWMLKNNYLPQLVLQLSFKCNLICKHCFNDKSHNDYEISLDEAKNIIDQAYELGITGVGLTGGECTCHKNFIEIAKYIREKGLCLYILTNGQAFYDNPDMFEQFIKLYPHQVKVSLYSMDPKIHDEITGVKGSQEKIVSVIKKMRKNNIKVVINCLQFKLNESSYIDVSDFAEEIGAACNISSSFISNYENKTDGLQLSDKARDDFYLDKKNPISIYHDSSEPRGVKRDDESVCRAAEIQLAVNPMLDVLPCNDFYYVLGNMKKDSLNYVWNNSVPKFRAIHKRKNLDAECGTHKYCDYCTYCPVHVCASSNSQDWFMKKSNSACADAISYLNALTKAHNVVEI